VSQFNADRAACLCGEALSFGWCPVLSISDAALCFATDGSEERP